MNKTNIIVGVIAVVALILGGISFFRATPGTVASTQTFGNTSIDGSQSNLPNPSNSDYAVSRLALGYGTNLSNSASGAGNINVEGQRANIVATSSVLCSITNPFNATSTIVNAAFYPTVGTSSSLSLVMGTSTSQYATSSSMTTQTVAAGSTGYPVTWDAGVNNSVIPPLGVLTFGVGAGSAVSYAYTYTGTCSALFQSL